MNEHKSWEEKTPEERAAAAAKLKASNDRSYARMAEINRIASETLVKTTHGSYTSGQYGQDYMTFGKAICEIRKLVKESVFDVAPDYEMLARQFARPSFDQDKLAKAIEALASEKPVDYPAFYTPGWLVDLAKKIEAQSPNPPITQSPNHPIIPGCPSLGPKVFPSGADGTEPAEDGKNSFFEFFGLKLNRFGGPGLGTRLIGKRVNHPSSQPSVQVFEIDVKRSNGVFGSTATATENGDLIFKIEGSVRFNVVEQMAVAALHRILKQRAYTNAKKRRRRTRKAAAKRAEAQALIDKELA